MTDAATDFVPPPPGSVPGSAEAADGESSAGDTPVQGSPPVRVTGLACPSCAGALDVDSGVRVVRCPYCETRLLAVNELGLRRFAVEPRVDLADARQRVRTWIGSGWNKDPRLSKEAEMGEAFLCFLPFFRVQADVVGAALGTEERRRTVGSGKNRRTETYEVDVERWVEKPFDRTFAAVNVAELGVGRVNLAGDRLIPLDSADLERRGMVFPPTRSEPDVRAAALREFREQADPAKGLKRVRFRFVETVREVFTVVYYPLWVVRYRFRDRAYLGVVDAEDGTLAYGKAPGNDLYRAVMLIGTEAAVCFAATTALQWAEDCGVAIAAAVFGGALLAWGWKRFRYGGVVKEGSGRVKEDTPSPVKKLLGRAG